MANTERTSRTQVVGSSGPIWLIGWLFTIGYLHLPFWKAVLALLIWPYDLGIGLRH